MKNFSNKKLSLIISSVALCATPFAFAPLTSCSATNTIQLANFESYMDSELMEHLRTSYDVQFQWFTVTEMIETKFRNTYDIAIPCGYELVKLYQKGWLQPIDWLAFEIPGVIDAETALTTLYAEPAQEAITQMNTSFQTYLDDTNFNVLNYGVPYFAQSFDFVYKGDEIDFYSAVGSHEKVDEPTWADVFYTVSPDCQYASRFGGKIGMLDDAKSIYDMSRIVETIEKNGGDPANATNEMPKNSSVESLKNTFTSLTSKAQHDWYNLKTDSGQIARTFADHGKYGYQAIMSWSGDALYAAQGAGEFDSYKGSQMHTVKPKGVSLDEIDFLVVNKKNKKNPKKLERIYKTIYDICFDGYDKTDILKKEGNRYKYWSMQNWDTVSYIPLLKDIYNEVSNTNSDYWDDYADEGDTETRDLFTSLIQFPQELGIKSLFGRPLTALQNSNTHWAWLDSKENL